MSSSTGTIPKSGGEVRGQTEVLSFQSSTEEASTRGQVAGERGSPQKKEARSRGKTTSSGNEAQHRNRERVSSVPCTINGSAHPDRLPAEKNSQEDSTEIRDKGSVSNCESTKLTF